MESSDTTTSGSFAPNEEQKQLIDRIFSSEETIVDTHYNSTAFCLSEIEANKRASLISDIEYTFSLALKKGDFYFG